MGKKKKSKHKWLKLLYIVFAIIVIIAGLYYENGYRDVNKFIGDIRNKAIEVYDKIANGLGEEENNNSDKKEKTIISNREYKDVNGVLEMHIIDVGQRR